MRPNQHAAERINGLLVEQLNNLPCFSVDVDGRSLKSEAKSFRVAKVEMLGTVAGKDKQNRKDRQTGQKRNSYLTINQLDSISFEANIVNTLGYFYNYTKL